MWAILLPALIQEAPVLVAQIIAILHKQGKITAQDVVDFVASFPEGGGASFFKPATPVAAALISKG
jgi:hypothetical protein